MKIREGCLKFMLDVQGNVQVAMLNRGGASLKIARVEKERAAKTI